MNAPPKSSQALEKAALRLRREVGKLQFSEPVTHVYNPLEYAWRSHREFLRLARPRTTQVVFLGMNPGPWGMAQTGVPFGEIDAVRGFLGIENRIDRPVDEHPKRPIEGFSCQRSEVSGKRLWGLFQKHFSSAGEFFRHHFIVNYCPLVFMEESGKNRTPDKLPAPEREPLHSICDEHLQTVIQLLSPRWLVAVGTYAEACLKRCMEQLAGQNPKTESMISRMELVRILHPSPASPAANRDWSGKAQSQLIEAGVWQS